MATATETDRRVAQAIRPIFEAWGEPALLRALAHLIEQDTSPDDRALNSRIAALLRRTAERIDELP